MPKKSSDLARVLAYFDSAPPEQAWDLLACLRERIKAKSPRVIHTGKPRKGKALHVVDDPPA